MPRTGSKVATQAIARAATSPGSEKVECAPLFPRRQERYTSAGEGSDTALSGIYAVIVAAALVVIVKEIAVND